MSLKQILIGTGIVLSSLLASTINSQTIDSTINQTKNILIKTDYSKEQNNYSIIIDKSDRRLYLYKDGILDTSFVAEFGFSYLEDKERKDDGKTPDGKFAIGLKNPEGWTPFYKSLMINYPDSQRVYGGLKKGVIDKATKNRLLNSLSQGKMPEQDTGLGGEICIHGSGGRNKDWTGGCVAVTNSDMDYIYPKAKIGTKVTIRK
jgi:murein L,D-transpeptidase YafK